MTTATSLSEESCDCKRVTRVYLLSVSGILFVLGLIKLVSAAGSQLVLQEFDPIIPMTNRLLYILSGSVELAIAVVLLRQVSRTLKLKLVSWISLVFLSYHTILWAYHWHGFCPCLGNVTEWLHLNPPQANTVVGTLNIHLLLGSLSLLIYTSHFCRHRRMATEKV